MGLEPKKPREAAKAAAPAKAAAKKGPGRKAGPSAQKGVKRKIKYRGPAGQPWSGVGRKPVWVVEALASGKALEEFAVQ